MDQSTDPSIHPLVNQYRVKVGECTIQRCPQEWKNLQDSGEATVKFCAVCWKNVHFAASPEEVKEFAQRGWCVAYEREGNGFLGYARLPARPPEHTEPDLLETISRHKRGEGTLEDLRFIAMRFLHHNVRNEALRYLRQFVDAGGHPDAQMIITANRFGIDATDPASGVA